MRFTRRQGPGGQHRNKVETAVILRHRPSGIVAEASERRAQGENLRTALRRLRIRLALGVRCPWTAPSELWQARCANGRIGVNPQHQDFPSLLAEALDALATRDWDTAASAVQLGCSASQLVRLLRRQPEALRLLNSQRAERGVRPLK